ncbi:acyl-CoA dehydrogenase family protein [Nocardia fluminea]|uniref:acyl-CoA dehydrogenase family protein n=1 Tax=Nocardia fluminea TaxID=134984 RepID=UPI00365ED7C0
MSITTDTSLVYSRDEEDLRATVREFLTATMPSSAILARIETTEPYDNAAWSTLAADIGAAGLPVDADNGGAGASWRETGVVAEEIGRAAAPLPYLGSAVLATATLLALPERQAATQVLTALAGGQTRATLAVPLSASPTVGPQITVREQDSQLTGSVTSVADLVGAELILVAATDADREPGLYTVGPTDDGVVIEPGSSLDLTRPLCTLHLDGVDAVPLAHGVEVEVALQHALTVAAAMLACEQVGIADYCLDTTLSYVKTRCQFGRQIGSYQAIKHRLADIYLDLTHARAAARYAAVCVATGDPDSTIAVSLAKALCSRVAQHATEEAIQLHGGIGFTWEHPLHLYLKRAKADHLAMGTIDAHQARLADVLGLGLAS